MSLTYICPGNLTIDPDAEWQRRLGSLGWDVANDVEYADGLMNLLRSMLRWEPATRPTVADLFTHRWFTTGHRLGG
jgi:hypothetical protein